MESSPSIDLDVIQMFNKKFEGKYENVRKPIIVNGLREIKPFKNEILYKERKLQEDYERQKPPPEPKSEPEPELIP
jgi:hypothetical protein